MQFHFSRLFPWSLPAVLIGAYIWSAIAATAAIHPSVGAVEDVRGQGWGISDGGQKYKKLGGDLVTMNEVVATDINSAMTMRFVDKTTMTLGPSAEITIDEMVYNPADTANDSVVFKLGKGSFYFVSGLVAKDKVTIITPTATIGIRGTELVINVDEDGSTSVGVAKGHAFMRSNRDGREVEVNVGNTARINKKGKVSKPFPGIDLTGDDDVDGKIPGVAEWLGEDKKDEDEEDHTEFSNDTLRDDLDLGEGDEGEDEDQNDLDENDSEQGDDEDGKDDDADHDEMDSENDDNEGDSGEDDDSGDSDDDGGDNDGGDSSDDGGDSDDDGGDNDGGDSSDHDSDHDSDSKH